MPQSVAWQVPIPSALLKDRHLLPILREPHPRENDSRAPIQRSHDYAKTEAVRYNYLEFCRMAPADFGNNSVFHFNFTSPHCGAKHQDKRLLRPTTEVRLRVLSLKHTPIAPLY